jgi:hypothetical protein
MKMIILAVAFALVPLAAGAEGAAPAVTVQDSLAPPICKKPLLITKMRKADDDSDFSDKAEAYKNCINAYADVQHQLAQKHLDAGNAAIAEFNAFAKESNEKRQGGDD